MSAMELSSSHPPLSENRVVSPAGPMPTNNELNVKIVELEAMMDSKFGLLQTQLNEQQSSFQSGFASLEALVRGLTGHKEKQMAEGSTSAGAIAEKRTDSVEVPGEPLSRGEARTGRGGQFHKTPKLDFPVFRGEDPVGWVRKAKKFFHFHPMTETEKVGCGGAVVDFLAAVAAYPKPDDKIRSTSLKVQGGGNAGNALTCASRLGLKPRLITKVANDAQGRSILEELEADGVDTSFVVVSSDHLCMIRDEERNIKTFTF